MLRRAPDALFGEICLAALPFMGCALLLTLLIVIFPDLAVWLPWLGGAGVPAERAGVERAMLPPVHSS